jgi:hypothetical protein
MEAVPIMRKFALAGAVAAAAALATTAPAFAGGGCSGPSSVQQYIECVPTASGSKGQSGNHTRPVPKSIQKKIDQQGGADAQQLNAMVSQSKYGAPTTAIKVHKVVKAKAKTHKAKKEAAKKKILSDSATRQSNPLAASVGVITDGSDGRLIALIALMAGVAAVVIVSALRRRRVTR